MNTSAGLDASPAIQPTLSSVSVLPVGQAGQMMLPIGTIYDQGFSSWCWAYSAFHALRTYYYNSPATDPVTESWRAAIKTIDSPIGLPAALTGNVGSLIGGFIGGNPMDFITGFQLSKGLSGQNWQNIDTTNRTAAFGMVADNIRRLIPSVYCDMTHCRMIYGFVSDGTNVTQFAMADSAANPSLTYLESAATLSASVDQIVTLLP